MENTQKKELNSNLYIKVQNAIKNAKLDKYIVIKKKYLKKVYHFLVV